MLSIMVNAGVLTQSEVDTFNTLGINTIDGFFNWLNGLPEGQKEPALKIFVDFINNPYWGMPLTGPSNQTGCQLTVYKPNNYQYAVQGAVDSSTRNLKLTVDTVTTNAAATKNANLGKNKSSSGCNTPWPLNFSQSGPYQNKKLCYCYSLTNIITYKCHSKLTILITPYILPTKRRLIDLRGCINRLLKIGFVFTFTVTNIAVPGFNQ